MLDNEYYSQALHGPYETYDLGDFVLEDGGTIRACTLAYATFGTLAPGRDNAVLVPTWFSGTNKIMEQAYIGPGRALDPDKYFIIVVNQIGGGLPARPTTRRGRSAWRTSQRCGSATTSARSGAC